MKEQIIWIWKEIYVKDVRKLSMIDLETRPKNVKRRYDGSDQENESDQENN